MVVSGALKPAGLEAIILEFVATRAIALCASEAIFSEYETVLSQPKFAAVRRDRIARLLSALKTEAVMITPMTRVSASPDEEDNRLLECAEAAAADYLITGNKRHFPKHWKSTRVVNAREFLGQTSRSEANL